MNSDQVIKFIDAIDCNENSSGDIPAKIIRIAKKRHFRINKKLHKYGNINGYLS